MSGRGAERDEYPTEDPTPYQALRDDGYRQEGGDYPVGSDVRSEEPVGEDCDARSETSADKDALRKQAAASVWFSGFFSGASYLPKPKRMDGSDVDEAMREELLEEKTYDVPRGYKYIEENLPEILQRKPTGRLRSSLIVFIIFTFVSFVFFLVSACPVPWYRGKNVTVGGLDYASVQYTLYKQKGGSQPEVTLKELRTCPIEKQFYQSMAASIIMAMMFSLIALLLATARLFGGKVGYGWIMVFGFFAFSWGLCGNAMSVSQFHLSRCDKPRYANIARLDAGFALSLIAWIFQMLGLLVMLVSTKMNVGPSLRNVRVMDTWFLVLTLIALLFFVVANATTIWKRHFGTADVRVVRVTYWHTELIMGNGTNIIYGRAQYRCSAYNKRIKASISFLILGTVTTFLSVLMGIGAYVKRGLRVGAITFAIISSVFLFISWVTSVAIFYRTLCTRSVRDSVYEDYPGVPSGMQDGYTKFQGYGLAEGVVLVIVGWILITVAAVANIAVPWPPVKVF